VSDLRRGAHAGACDVVAVFAHPDDESLLAGGTLAACAAAGMTVGIVSMTRGELGLAGGSGAVGEAALGDLRERELIEASDVLGAAWARCLDLPDGELASIDRAAAVDVVREAIAVRERQVVLTFSAEGLYWHPDHVATHEIVRSAFPAASIYELSWPEGLLSRTVEELRRRGLPADVWGLDPHAFGVPAETIERELDVSALLEVKLRALRCHASQLLAGHALADLPDDLARELLGREWFVRCPDAAWLERVVAQGRAVGGKA
jgi:LmbE family N-acetylglucosaminyl deacetylase